MQTIVLQNNNALSSQNPSSSDTNQPERGPGRRPGGVRQSRINDKLLPGRRPHARARISPWSSGEVATSGEEEDGQVTNEVTARETDFESSFSPPSFPDFPGFYEDFPNEYDAHDFPIPESYSSEFPIPGVILDEHKGTQEVVRPPPLKVLVKGRRPGVIEFLRKKLTPPTIDLDKAGQEVQRRVSWLVGRTAQRAALFGQVTGEVLGAGVVAAGEARDSLLQVSGMVQ